MKITQEYLDASLEKQRESRQEFKLRKANICSQYQKIKQSMHYTLYRKGTQVICMDCPKCGWDAHSIQNLDIKSFRWECGECGARVISEIDELLTEAMEG